MFVCLFFTTNLYFILRIFCWLQVLEIRKNIVTFSNLASSGLYMTSKFCLPPYFSAHLLLLVYMFLQLKEQSSSCQHSVFPGVLLVQFQKFIRYIFNLLSNLTWEFYQIFHHYNTHLQFLILLKQFPWHFSSLFCFLRACCMLQRQSQII